MNKDNFDLANQSARPLVWASIDEDMAAVDELPLRIREVLKLSPYKFSAISALRLFREYVENGGSLTKFIAILHEKILGAQAGMARDAYGPNHPQAR